MVLALVIGLLNSDVRATSTSYAVAPRTGPHDRTGVDDWLATGVDGDSSPAEPASAVATGVVPRVVTRSEPVAARRPHRVMRLMFMSAPEDVDLPRDTGHEAPPGCDVRPRHPSRDVARLGTKGWRRT
jgi:hypothetical protein